MGSLGGSVQTAAFAERRAPREISNDIRDAAPEEDDVNFRFQKAPRIRSRVSETDPGNVPER